MTDLTTAPDDQAPDDNPLVPVDPRDAELDKLRALLTAAQAPADPRDAQIAELKQLLAEATARANAPTITTDVVERTPYLVALDCGHVDTADNAAAATHHHCPTCDLTVPVRSVFLKQN